MCNLTLFFSELNGILFTIESDSRALHVIRTNKNIFIQLARNGKGRGRTS